MIAAVVAQGADAITALNPISMLLGVLGTAVGTLMTWILKEQNKKMDHITAAIGGLAREIRDGNKVNMALAHRQKGLESAIQMEVLTRTGVPKFLRDQLESKLQKRDRGEETRDEQ